MTADKPIVLVGAGHAHLEVARQAQRFRAQGLRLVLIDPGRFWYSGLATGMLGGMYSKADDQIDPHRLIETCGGESLRAKVIQVDTFTHTLTLTGGAKLDYALVSFNVGSHIATPAWTSASASEHIWPVKPLVSLWQLRQCLLERWAHGARPRVVVVGGGATGTEIAANLDGLARRQGRRLRVILITAADRLLTQHPRALSLRLAALLRRRGVEIHFGSAVAAVTDGEVCMADGDRLPFDELVLATGLVANTLLQQLGLPCEGRMGLLVTPQLHSAQDPDVFAAGDCAAIIGYDLPKVGVFGVRAAPVLCHNLLARMRGATLKPYRPQRRYLSVLNLGDGTGLASWGKLWWRGRLSLWFKDRIDRRFLEKYRTVYR